MKAKQRIYMDHAATTPVDSEVLKEMQPYFSEKFGNASSLHSFGIEARDALEDARARIARIINANTEEIIFTSGGTEADNMAIKEIAFANRTKTKNHIITTKIEHDAVLESCKLLENAQKSEISGAPKSKDFERMGFEITYLDVDKDGLVKPVDVEKAITPKTLLVSIMHANNEIGTIEPISEIGRICREKRVYFHTDAVQTFGKLPIDVKKMNIDLLSASSHKIYGPKGAGFLYIRKGTKIGALMHGGGHEFGLRSGTENVAGIVGMAKAAELASKNMFEENKKLCKLRDYMIKELLKIPGTKLNGHSSLRLANNINISFNKIEGESILLHLDKFGIAASTGSACSSKSLEPSHVLLALGLSHIEAHGSLRLTLGKSNTEKDAEYVLKVLPKIVKDLRKLSPLK